MERFGARTWTADDFCLAKVRECDVFVGIAGFRYVAPEPIRAPSENSPPGEFSDLQLRRLCR